MIKKTILGLCMDFLFAIVAVGIVMWMIFDKVCGG
jgi:hypothetical protein